MKQVKKLLMAITLLIGIGIPQVVNAQAEKRIVTSEDIVLLKELGSNFPNLDELLGKNFPIDMLIEMTKSDPFLKKQREQADQLPINLVGKWINKNDDKAICEFYADNTVTFKLLKGMELTVNGTDISYPLKALLRYSTWKREGNKLTLTHSEMKYILGDISYYPTDIQYKIKADVQSRENDYSKEPSEIKQYVITSFSPEAMVLKEGRDEYAYVRDVSGMSTQEKNEYNKEIEKWNQIKKEKEKKTSNQCKTQFNQCT